MAKANEDPKAVLKQQYDELIVARKQLFAEVNFLFGKAIPKLEHEYLYCISLLEQEATIIQSEIALKSEMIRCCEIALSNNSEVDQEKLQISLQKIKQEWEVKIKKHAYRSDTDFSILPKFSHEREYRTFLFKSTLNSINMDRSNRIEDHYTDLFRRITTAYRDGNLGELRALRMIIEGKQYLNDTSERKFSFKRGIQFLLIRIRGLFSTFKK